MARDEKKKKKSNLLHEMPAEDKDPFRWVTLVLFLVILFVSYVFWLQGK